MLWSFVLAIAIAQDTVPALRLGDVYRDVQASSPRALAARELASAARSRISPAALPPDPQLQIGWMNYALPELAPMDPLGMVQLQLMQMLPLGGKLRATGTVARARADAADDRAREVAWDARTRSAMAFYDLYATDASLGVARETLRLLQDVLRTAEAMYRVGEGRQADVLRAQVEIARMEQDTLRMTAMRAGMGARLNALLDRPADVAVGHPVLPRFPDSLPPLADLVAASDSGRPMLRAARRDVDGANAGATLARREIWPDLTVGVQYGQRGSAMGTGTERMGSLMLGASLPVFANSRQLRMREEAAAMVRMANAELAAMRADTRAAVAAAHADLTRARSLAVLYRTTIIPQAEATVASALAAYRVGSVDFMTLLDDRMAVNQFRQELFALDAEQGKMWAELEMLVGRALFDAGTTREGR